MPLVSEDRLGDLLVEEAKNRRLDRLCVIAAGVASNMDMNVMSSPEGIERAAAEYVSLVSRAILAKLEGE